MISLLFSFSCGPQISDEKKSFHKLCFTSNEIFIKTAIMSFIRYEKTKKRRKAKNPRNHEFVSSFIVLSWKIAANFMEKRKIKKKNWSWWHAIVIFNGRTSRVTFNFWTWNFQGKSNFHQNETIAKNSEAPKAREQVIHNFR